MPVANDLGCHFPDDSSLPRLFVGVVLQYLIWHFYRGRRHIIADTAALQWFAGDWVWEAGRGGSVRWGWSGLRTPPVTRSGRPGTWRALKTLLDDAAESDDELLRWEGRVTAVPEAAAVEYLYSPEQNFRWRRTNLTKAPSKPATMSTQSCRML